MGKSARYVYCVNTKIANTIPAHAIQATCTFGDSGKEGARYATWTFHVEMGNNTNSVFRY